jgi:hypothetical protein
VTDRHELAIARSVIYASLFDYPLTLDQLHETLISTPLSRADVLAAYHASTWLPSVVEHRDGFFFPSGAGHLIGERHAREARSRTFLRTHRRLLQWICALPYTRMVALSGSVAHLNLEEGGDLDLFIVTRGRRVWTVTMAMIALTRLLGARRIVCANFVMSDEHLTIDQQDLFTANQALHLKPLCGPEVLEGFVAANPFVHRFYPNRQRSASTEQLLPPARWLARGKRLLELLLAVPSPAIEALCRRVYTHHLRRRSTSWRSPDQVQLDADYLKLHTQSHRHSVLDRYEARLEDALERRKRAAIA